MNLFFCIIFYFTLCVLSCGLTYLVRLLAIRKKILDIPNHRSSHQVPVPRGGGLAFVILFYLALGVLFELHMVSLQVLMALLGGIAIALIGYFDDLYALSAPLRLLVHLSAAIWCVYWLKGGGGFWGEQGLLPSFLSYGFAALWAVWLINLYNFMDGIDGIATTQGIFVSSVAGIVLLAQGSGLSALCFTLAEVLLGFLVWNWSPAKIFMGDVASGFLGFVFAALSLATSFQHVLPVTFWWLLLSVFLCDATFTLVKRIARQEKWYSAHCDHLYQRLVRKGYSHAKVSGAILLFNLVVVAPVSLLFVGLHTLVVEWLYLAIFFIVMFALWCILLARSIPGET